MAKHYKKKLRLNSKNNPVARFGLVFGVLFGGLMTAVGLSALFAASVTVSLSPVTQNANPGQNKTISVVVNATSETFNGGYVQLNFDASKLAVSGVEAASSQFAVQQQTVSGGGIVFRFTTTNPAGLTGSQTAVNIRFNTLSVSGTQTAQISGGAVAYKNVGDNPQYFPGSALSASITISQPPQIPPQNPPQNPPQTPPQTTTPTTKPNQTPNTTPTTTPTPEQNAETTTENAPGELNGDAVPEGYENVPGLFGDGVFTEEKSSGNPVRAVIFVLIGLVLLGGGFWFYKHFPHFAARRQFKKADTKPVVQSYSQLHAPQEVKPAAEKSEEPPLPIAPQSVSHHTSHAFPESTPAKAVPKPHSETTETKAAQPETTKTPHTEPSKVIHHEPPKTIHHEAQPAQKPHPAPVPHASPLPPPAKPVTQPAAAAPTPKPEPEAKQKPQPAPAPKAPMAPKPVETPKVTLPQQTAPHPAQPTPTPTVTVAGVNQKQWDDIRKEQAAKIAHAHKDVGADEDLPDMFELAEQHPESFGSQTLYDEETNHSAPAPKKE